MDSSIRRHKSALFSFSVNYIQQGRYLLEEEEVEHRLSELVPSTAIGRVDQYYDSTIVIACTKGWSKVLKELLRIVPEEHQIMANRIDYDFDKNTCIGSAMINGHWDCVNILLDYSVDIYGDGIYTKSVVAYKNIQDIVAAAKVVRDHCDLFGAREFFFSVLLHEGSSDWNASIPDDDNLYEQVVVEVVDIICQDRWEEMITVPCYGELVLPTACGCRSVSVIQQIMHYIPDDAIHQVLDAGSEYISRGTCLHETIGVDPNNIVNEPVASFFLERYPYMASKRDDEGRTPVDLLRAKKPSVKLSSTLASCLADRPMPKNALA